MASRTSSSTWPSRAPAAATPARSPRRSRRAAPSMNAATDYERTSYFVRCLRADAPEMLDVALSLVFAPRPSARRDRAREVRRPAGDRRGRRPARRSGVRTGADGQLSRSPAGPAHPRHRGDAEVDHARRSLSASPPATMCRTARSSPLPARSTAPLSRTSSDRWLAAASRAARDLFSRPVPTAPCSVRTEARKLEQTHLVLARRAPSGHVRRSFRRAHLCRDFRRRHGLAPVPGSPREQGPRLHDRCFVPSSTATCGRISVYAGCDAERRRRSREAHASASGPIWRRRPDRSGTGARQAPSPPPATPWPPKRPPRAPAPPPTSC